LVRVDTGIPDGLPDTGQERSFYSGDDGYYDTGCQPSYTDNGDGTVTDDCTGLMWQQEDDNVERDWWDAIDYCGAMELVGRTDWRLPNIRELQSIVDYGSHPSPMIDTTYFPGTKSSDYWSSSTNVNGTFYVWRVDFRRGCVDYDARTLFKYVRCVR